MSNLPFSLPAPGGTWTWTPTAGTGGTLPLPNLPSLPGAQGAPDLLTALTPVLSAANPQIGAILSIVGVLFQIGHALQTQAQAAPGDTTMQNLNNMFWQQVLGVFAPHAPAPANPAGN